MYRSGFRHRKCLCERQFFPKLIDYRSTAQHHHGLSSLFARQQGNAYVHVRRRHRAQRVEVGSMRYFARGRLRVDHLGVQTINVTVTEREPMESLIDTSRKSPFARALRQKRRTCGDPGCYRIRLGITKLTGNLRHKRPSVCAFLFVFAPSSLSGISL